MRGGVLVLWSCFYLSLISYLFSFLIHGYKRTFTHYTILSQFAIRFPIPQDEGEFRN